MGVRQGCPLSSTLFLIFMNTLSVLIARSHTGIELGASYVSELLLADDLMLMAETKADLKKLLDIAGSFACGYGMEFNADKCSVLTFNEVVKTGPTIWFISNNIIAESDQYKYLGITITSKGRNPTRIALEIQALP